MKRVVPLVLVCSIGTPAFAQNLAMPEVKAGDTWTYRVTSEKGASGWSQTHDETTVVRVTSTTIYYTLKQSGSTQPAKDLFSGLDWSRSREIGGRETIVNQPLSFPLHAGKTWDVHYTEPHPNKSHKSETWTHQFKVVGFENVEVPAGTFKALKVEEEGHWTAELEPAQTVLQGAEVTSEGASMATAVHTTQTGSASGRTYKAFWYAPEARRWVKSVEEYYGSGGARSERFTGELESFKLVE